MLPERYLLALERAYLDPHHHSVWPRLSACASDFSSGSGLRRQGRVILVTASGTCGMDCTVHCFVYLYSKYSTSSRKFNRATIEKKKKKDKVKGGWRDELTYLGREKRKEKKRKAWQKSPQQGRQPDTLTAPTYVVLDWAFKNSARLKGPQFIPHELDLTHSPRMGIIIFISSLLNLPRQYSHFCIACNVLRPRVLFGT